MNNVECLQKIPVRTKSKLPREEYAKLKFNQLMSHNKTFNQICTINLSTGHVDIDAVVNEFNQTTNGEFIDLNETMHAYIVIKYGITEESKTDKARNKFDLLALTDPGLIELLSSDCINMSACVRHFNLVTNNEYPIGKETLIKHIKSNYCDGSYSLAYEGKSEFDRLAKQKNILSKKLNKKFVNILECMQCFHELTDYKYKRQHDIIYEYINQTYIK